MVPSIVSTLLRADGGGFTMSGNSELTVIRVGSGVTEHFIFDSLWCFQRSTFNDLLKYQKKNNFFKFSVFKI